MTFLLLPILSLHVRCHQFVRMHLCLEWRTLLTLDFHDSKRLAQCYPLEAGMHFTFFKRGEPWLTVRVVEAVEKAVVEVVEEVVDAEEERSREVEMDKTIQCGIQLQSSHHHQDTAPVSLMSLLLLMHLLLHPLLTAVKRRL